MAAMRSARILVACGLSACLVAGLGAIALEPRVPEHARLTPLDLPAAAIPVPIPEEPAGERLTARFSG